MAMPTLEDILRDRIKELEEEIKTQDGIIDGLQDDLKCYEDADEQGLLIKLPCKVGDEVYFIKSAFSFSKSPMRGTVCMIKTFSSKGTFTFNVVMDESNQARTFINCDIGKTVFLTREEAEEALKDGR